jgi:NAD+ synthase (glutamine-hydrolysing)
LISVVGPYALQDFKPYYATRHGFRPQDRLSVVERLARRGPRGRWPANTPDAVRLAYPLAEIKHWLRVFLSTASSS